MPVSQMDFYDVGLDDLREEKVETCEDSQRVVYEGPSMELRLLYGVETSPRLELTIKFVKNITSDRKSEKVNFSTAKRLKLMEGISKYSGIGGGLS